MSPIEETTHNSTQFMTVDVPFAASADTNLDGVGAGPGARNAVSNMLTAQEKGIVKW